MRIEKQEKITLTHEEVELLDSAQDLLDRIYNESENDAIFLPAINAVSNIDEILGFCSEEE